MYAGCIVGPINIKNILTKFHQLQEIHIQDITNKGLLHILYAIQLSSETKLKLVTVKSMLVLSNISEVKRIIKELAEKRNIIIKVIARGK